VILSLANNACWAFLFLLVFPTLARGEYQTFKGILKQIDRQNHQHGDGCDDHNWPKCSELIDAFCADLWSKSNPGNLDYGNAKIRLGNTGNFRISEARKIDLEALIDAKERLPADLKANMGSLLDKIDVSLKTKSEDKYGDFNISGLYLPELDAIVEKTALERALGSERAKQVKYIESLKGDDFVKVKRALTAIKSEVVTAKYKDHPNWKRVETQFVEAKQDIIAVIGEMTIPESDKVEMIDKVKRVTLRLPTPFENPIEKILKKGLGRTQGMNALENSCGTTMVNARYLPNSNEMLICAGFFNSFQSDDLIYQVIGHEISHAVDPTVRAIEKFNKTNLGQVLKRLVEGDGNAYSCEEWNKISAEMFKRPEKIEAKPTVFEKQINCFGVQEGLKKFNEKSIRAAAAKVNQNEMPELKNRKYVWPNREKYHWKIYSEVDRSGKPNPNFLRPHAPIEESLANIEFQDDDVAHPDSIAYIQRTGFIFAQNMKCDPDIANVKTKWSREGIKNYEQIYNRTREMNLAIQEQFYNSCGRECPGLQEAGLGFPSSEYWSDWSVNKGFSKRLDRMHSISEKRNAAAMAGAMFCERPMGVEAWIMMLPLRAVRLALPKDSHPHGEDRSHGVFKKDVQSKVMCKEDDDKQVHFTDCEP